MRVDELAEPEGDDELFDVGEEALRLKPFMTGDVFVDVPGHDNESITVMIGGHPCVIRGGGGRLSNRVPCFVLKPTESRIPYTDWPEHHWDKFPLSDALGLGTRQAARLNEWTSVHRSELLRGRRRVTLTERGVYILQQRLTHSLTRCVVPLTEFEIASKHVLREVELEWEWVADLVPGGESAAESDINPLVREFHRFLDAEGRRELLKQPGGEARLRALVREELQRRRRDGAV